MIFDYDMFRKLYFHHQVNNFEIYIRVRPPNLQCQFFKFKKIINIKKLKKIKKLLIKQFLYQARNITLVALITLRKIQGIRNF
jgi:hypothetical protein